MSGRSSLESFDHRRQAGPEGLTIGVRRVAGPFPHDALHTEPPCANVVPERLDRCRRVATQGLRRRLVDVCEARAEIGSAARALPEGLRGEQRD